VQSVSVLRQKVKVLVEVDDEKELREYEVDELKFKHRRKNTKLSAKELAQIGELEVLEEDHSAVEDDAELKSERNDRSTNREGREPRERNDRTEHGRERGKSRGRRDYQKDKEQAQNVEQENREPRQRRNNNGYYKNRNKNYHRDQTERGEKTHESRERKPAESR